VPVLISHMIARLEGQIFHDHLMRTTGTIRGEYNPGFLTYARHGVQWWAT